MRQQPPLAGRVRVYHGMVERVACVHARTVTLPSPALTWGCESTCDEGRGGGDLRARRRIGILLLRHGRMRCLSGVLCSPRRSCLAGASGSCRYRSALRGFLRSRRSAARRGFRGFHFRRTATLLQRIYVSSNDSLCWRCRALAGKGGE
jgi:hypothetical protein